MSHALIALPGMRLGIPSPDPLFSHFSIGPVTIQTYALCILAAITAAVIITRRRLAARGGQPGQVLDIIVWAVPFGIVGARIYHVVTHSGDYFYPGANPLDLFAIWEGGVAIYGGLIGGAIGAYVGCRRAGIRLLSFADVLAPAMLVAQAIGRLGNWFNHELFGLPTTLPWGLEILPTDSMFPDDLPVGTLFHPLFLYEIIWNLIGLGVILFLERRFSLRWGKVWALYLIWYGLGRSWLEAIRIDPTTDVFIGIPANDWTSFLAIAVGIGLYVVQTRRHPEPEPSIFSEGRASTGVSASASPHGSPESAEKVASGTAPGP
jgi:prolipoprotein diacylglyceryl transferase